MTDLMTGDRRKWERELSFDNFNGTNHTVEFSGSEIRLEHGFNFTPKLEYLTITVKWAKGSLVQVFLSDRNPDEKYVYLKGMGRGTASIFVGHPNQKDSGDNS